MKKLQGILVAIVVSILIAILYWLVETPNVIFLGNLIVLLLIIIKAKFSYFSIKVLVINYALMAVFFQYNTGKSYGILEISPLELHYLKMNLLIYIYNLITYIWITNTKILEKENELLQENYKVGWISTYFCCFLAIITAIIAFPGMPFDPKYLDNRFIGLVQGSAWNHLSIVCLLFVLPKFKKNNLVKITYLFVVFWFISHYERVDIIGILLLSLIYILVRKKKIKLRTYIIVRSSRSNFYIYNGIFRGIKS